MELTLLDVVNFFLTHKKKLIIHGILSLVLGVLLSLTFTKYYKATVLFAPLSAQSSSSSGLLAMATNLGVGAMPGDLTQTGNYSKRLYSTLFESRSLREEIVEEFELIKVYKTSKSANQLGLALKALNKNIGVSEVEEGGLGVTNVIAIELSVVDSDPIRAAEMANTFYEKIEKKVVEFGQLENTRRITFLEEQLLICEDSLLRSRDSLQLFQSQNHIYDIKLQGELVIEAIGSLKSQQLSLENQLSYNRREYGPSNSQTKSTQRQLSIINAKLLKMENDTTPNFFGGLQGSLPLQYKFVDLRTKVEVYSKLKMALSQQLEERKIKLDRTYSDLYLIDEAVPPTYKFKPKRALIAIGFSFVWVSCLIIILFLKNLQGFVKTLPESNKIKIFFAALKKW